MKLERGNLCPFLKKDCVQLQCTMFIKLVGKDPQNPDKPIDEWGCSLAWMPILMIETANEVRTGAAATESFRNEMVEQGNQTLHAMEVARQTAVSIARLQMGVPPGPNSAALEGAAGTAVQGLEKLSAPDNGK